MVGVSFRDVPLHGIVAQYQPECGDWNRNPYETDSPPWPLGSCLSESQNKPYRASQNRQQIAAGKHYVPCQKEHRGHKTSADMKNRARPEGRDSTFLYRRSRHGWFRCTGEFRGHNTNSRVFVGGRLFLGGGNGRVCARSWRETSRSPKRGPYARDGGVTRRIPRRSAPRETLASRQSSYPAGTATKADHCDLPPDSGHCYIDIATACGPSSHAPDCVPRIARRPEDGPRPSQTRRTGPATGNLANPREN